jgi:hypothetical protein
MMERSETVHHRHLGGRGQLGDRLVGAGADHDRVDVTGEDAGRVADRFSAADLQLEYKGDAAAGQRLGADAVSPARFQLERPVEQLAQLERPQLFACEEVPRRHQGFAPRSVTMNQIWTFLRSRSRG